MGNTQVKQAPPKCNFLGCSNIAMPDSMACPLHICHVKICNELKTSTTPFCMHHSCHIKGCQSRIADSPFSEFKFCHTHSKLS